MAARCPLPACLPACSRHMLRHPAAVAPGHPPVSRLLLRSAMLSCKAPTGVIHSDGRLPRKALLLRFRISRVGWSDSPAGNVPERPSPGRETSTTLPVLQRTPFQRSAGSGGTSGSAPAGVVPQGSVPATQAVPGTAAVAPPQLLTAAGRVSSAATDASAGAGVAGGERWREDSNWWAVESLGSQGGHRLA